MTDARLPDRWLNDPRLERLSDKAWRMFTGSLMFSAGQGTDGVIGARQMRLLHPDGEDLQVTGELIFAGLWQGYQGGIRVSDWTGSQSTAEQVEAYRKANAERQAKWRSRQSRPKPPVEPSEVVDPEVDVVTGEITGDVTRYVTGDVMDDVTPYVGKAKAKAKALGKARLESENQDDLERARLRLIESRSASAKPVETEELPDLSQPEHAWAAAGYDS